MVESEAEQIYERALHEDVAFLVVGDPLWWVLGRVGRERGRNGMGWVMLCFVVCVCVALYHCMYLTVQAEVSFKNAYYYILLFCLCTTATTTTTTVTVTVTAAVTTTTTAAASTSSSCVHTLTPLFHLPSFPSATTHTDLMLRARNIGVKVEVIHNASAMGAAAASGLQV